MKRLALLLLAVLAIGLSVLTVPVHADSTFYNWPISDATNGENTNCQNFWDILASVTTISNTNYFNHDGIRTTNNSWAGKTLSSATLYVMRLSGSTGSGVVTFGSFNSANGNLIASLATINYASLPVCVSSAPVATTFSGLNYLIPSGAYLGLSYSGTAQDNVVNYFDYNSGNVALPNVFEYLIQCDPFNSCSFNDFSGAYSPMFGSFTESQARPPEPPPDTPKVASTPAPFYANPIVNIALAVLAVGFIVYTAWEAEQDDFK